MSKERDFWSRRRAAVRAEEVAEEQAVETRVIAAEQAELEALEDAEILERLDLPDPDTLVAGDDVRRFMARAVPERLRRRALRQLWRLNPVLANLDGLIDYGDDYTDAANSLEPLQTTYQVGKGMLAHVQEMARQAELRAAAAATETETEVAPEPEIEVVDEPEPTPALMADAVTDDDCDPTTPRPARRMRFSCEETS